MTAYSALGVLLECAAVATVLSCVAAFVALALSAVGAARGPSVRADIAFVGAVMPALVVIVALAAALAPTLAVALGVSAVDHCPEHLHHPHLCFVHFDGLRPAAAVLGAFALAVFAARAITLVVRHARTASSIAKIEALADVAKDGTFPLLRLPGAARVCHAVGVGPARRRVLVSQALIDALSPQAWLAVRAHEEEHLRRRDPLAMVVVEFALLLVPPFIAAALGRAFRRAAEAACDAAAARALGVGGVVAVAEGLLEAARVVGNHRAEIVGAPAATDSSLEERVRDLLEDRPSKARPSLGFAAAAAMAVALVAVGFAYNASLHHALETLLFHLT